MSDTEKATPEKPTLEELNERLVEAIQFQGEAARAIEQRKRDLRIYLNKFGADLQNPEPPVTKRQKPTPPPKFVLKPAWPWVVAGGFCVLASGLSLAVSLFGVIRAPEMSMVPFVCVLMGGSALLTVFIIVTLSAIGALVISLQKANQPQQIEYEYRPAAPPVFDNSSMFEGVPVSYGDGRKTVAKNFGTGDPKLDAQLTELEAGYVAPVRGFNPGDI